MKSLFPGKLAQYLVLAWASALILAWALIQPGLSADAGTAGAMLQSLQSILAALLLFTGAAGTGMVLGSPLREQRILCMYAAPLLGLGLISTLILAAGLLHNIPGTITAWVVLLAVNAAFLPQTTAWIRILRKTFSQLFAPTPSRSVSVLRAGVLLLIAMALLIALAPPIEWDSLMYHLAAGRYYIDQGGVVTSADNYRFSNPALTTMLFMLLQILAGASAPALLSWLLGVWTLAGIAVFFLQCDKAALENTWTASALAFSTGTIWIATTRSYADILLIPVMLASMMMLLPGRGSKSSSQKMLAGILCGMLVAAKYTAFPFCIGLGLLAVFSRSTSKSRIRSLLLLTAAALAAFSPWLLKNWLLDGNPIAPYIWGSPAFDAYDRARTLPTSFGNPLSNLIVLPLQAAVYGSEHIDPFQGSIGPVLVGLFPAVFLFRKQLSENTRRLLGALLLTAAPAYLTWTIGASFTQNLAIVRFFLPMFLLMALMITIWQAALPEGTGVIPWEKAATVLGILALGLGIINGALHLARSRPLPVILGLQSTDSYLESQLGNYHSLAAEIRSTAKADPETRVLMLWEPRTLYCQPACTGDDNLNTWQKALDSEGSGEAVLEFWEQQGYTHVLISHRGAEFLLGQKLDRIPRLTRYDELLVLIPGRLHPVQEYDDYGLYKLR